MRFYVRTIFGLLIGLGAAALFLFGLYQLLKGGTCASGGPYVSTRQCPSGTTAWMFALPPAILASIGGFWLFRTRGPRDGAPTPVTYHAAQPRDVFHQGVVVNRDYLFANLAKDMPATVPADPIVRLEKLQALLAAGVLSPEEFQQAKAKILAEM